MTTQLYRVSQKSISREKLLTALLEAAIPYAKNDGFNETEVPGLWICRETHVQKHCKPKFSVPVAALTLQGRKRLVVAGDIYDIRPGKLIFHSTCLPTECFIEEASLEEPFISVVTAFDKGLIAELLPRFKSSPITPIVNPRPVSIGEPEFQEISGFWQLLTLPQQSNQIDLFAPILQQALHASFLTGSQGQWLRSLQTSSAHGYKITEAIGQMQQNFANNINIDEMASSVGMSPASFYRHFKSFTGCSPNQYLKRLRLHKAKHLLTSTDRSVSVVAYSVGYKSCSQFCTDFKRLYNEQARNSRLVQNRVL